jgi:hypothetical protein
MATELIRGRLMEIDGEHLIIRAPEGETLALLSQGLGIDEAWIKTWLGVGGMCFTVTDGVVVEVSKE